jgi:hypothetical protein
VEATPLSIVLGLSLVSALFIAVAIIKRILRDGVLPRAGLSRAGSSAVATLTSYGVLIVGLLTILPITFPGFNLNTLSVMLGAISFGIGFGLRNIADNFVSGLILLFERPIKVGDRIEVGGTAGEVLEVRARSTVVRTNDHIEIIVPNSQLLSEQVTNWSHSSNLGDDYAAIAGRVGGRITALQRADWQYDSVIEWANESYQITIAPATRYCVWQQGACWYSADNMMLDSGEVRRELAISNGYLRRQGGVVERRLQQAGVRLAQLLNQVLVTE